MNPGQTPKPIPIVLVRKSEPAPAATAAVTDPVTSWPARAVRPVGRRERLVRVVTQLSVSLPLVVVCLAMLGWSLFFRLPSRPLMAHARSSFPAPPLEQTIDEEKLAVLRTNAARVAVCLVEQADEITRTLSVLEREARQQGFTVHVSMKPAIARPSGLDELEIHPAVISLESSTAESESAYRRLLRWMQVASSLGRKVDLAAVNVRANVGGVVQAQVELHFWSRHAIHETAAK